MRWIGCLTGVCVWIVAPSVAPAQTGKSELAGKAHDILRTHCYRCHGERGAVEGGVNFLLDRNELARRGKIAPGDASKSAFLQRIVSKEMPPDTEKARPTAADIDVLTQWINAGAPDWAAPAKRAFITTENMHEAMWNDLAKLAEDDQRSTRYFTLTHLYNSGASDDELETYRQAMTKLVNSLSWMPKVAVPVAVDKERTIYRIDLRHYKWTKKTWGLVTSNYPYTVITKSDVERRCREATQFERFHVRADWFAAHATTGDHYYQILQLPLNAQELRKLFGVAADDDLTSGKVQRAGFLGSRVTPTARLIERHETHFGALWIATSLADMKPLMANPLAHAEARGAGQQALFHLPNGMLGYVAWDASGKRTGDAKGLQEVRLKGAGVKSALACMSCHTQGVVAKSDDVLEQLKKSAVDKAMLDKAAILYPSAAKLQEIVDDDNALIAKAMKSAGVRVGGAEPIAALALRHEEDFDVPRLAAELGMTREQFLQRMPGSKYGKLFPSGNVMVKRRGLTEIYGDLAQSIGLGAAPSRITATYALPAVFPQLLLPARGMPTAIDTTIVAKKPPLASAAIPAPKPFEIANRLTVNGLREHLVCGFSSFRGDQHPMAISPKERLVALEMQQGVVTVFDPETAEQRFQLDAHNAAITAIEFSADGKLIATAGQDGTVKIWRATSGLLLSTLPTKGAVHLLAFASDSKSLATVGAQLQMWTAPQGQSIRLTAPKQGPGWGRILALSSDLKLAVGTGKSLGIFDTATGQERAALKAGADGGGFSTVAAFSPDGKWLATSGIAAGIRLWDLKTFDEKTILRGHTAPVNALAFSPDSKLLVSAAGKATGPQVKPGELKIWEVDIESHWKSLDGHTRAVTRVAIGADGKLLLSGGPDGTARLWSLDKNTPTVTRKAAPEPFEGHFGAIRCVAESADGQRLLTGGSDGTVRLWNAKTGAELKALAGHAKDVRAVAFSSDGAMAYSAGDDLKLLQWDLDKGTIVKKIDLPQRTWEMQFAPSGKYLIIGIDGAANQINMTTGRTVRKINLFTKSITAFAISPDERTIAAADIQCNVSLWNLDTEKSRSLRSLPRGPEPANGITSLAFSPDGHWLVSGAMGAEKTASLWDLKTDAEVHRVGPFPGFVRDAIFAADSKSFYVASGLTGLQPKKKLAALVNCSITQFDTETGQPTQFWDQFPHLPLHLFRGGEARQMIVVVHDKLIRQSTENGKSISAP